MQFYVFRACDSRCCCFFTWIFAVCMIALFGKLYNVAAHVQCNEHATALPSHLVTQTVYGFLDFTTTIGNTIMVFSPQSSPAPGMYKLVFSYIGNKAFLLCDRIVFFVHWVIFFLLNRHNIAFTHTHNG